MKHANKQNLTTAELELTMTRSSMGFEYAMKKLRQQDAFGLDIERVNAQIDEMQQIYFAAREKFLTMDSSRLQEFELDLCRQKSNLFAATESVLHWFYVDDHATHAPPHADHPPLKNGLHESEGLFFS